MVLYLFADMPWENETEKAVIVIYSFANVPFEDKIQDAVGGQIEKVVILIYDFLWEDNMEEVVN